MKIKKCRHIQNQGHNDIIVMCYKFLAHLLLIRSNEEIIRNKHFMSQENDGIFHIFEQI